MKQKLLTILLVVSASLPLVNGDVVEASRPAAGACESTDGKKCVRVGQPCPKRGNTQTQRVRIGASQQIRLFTCGMTKRKLQWREDDIGYLMFWDFDDFELLYKSGGYPLRVHEVYCSLQYSPPPTKRSPSLQVRYTIPGFAELVIYSDCGASVTNMSDVYRLPYTPSMDYGVFLMRELGVDKYGERFKAYNFGRMRCRSNCNGLAPGATAELWAEADQFLIKGTRTAIEKLYADFVDPIRREGLDLVAFEITGGSYNGDLQGCHLLGAQTSVSVLSSYRLSQYGDVKSCLFPDVQPIW